MPLAQLQLPNSGAIAQAAATGARRAVPAAGSILELGGRAQAAAQNAGNQALRGFLAEEARKEREDAQSSARASAESLQLDQQMISLDREIIKVIPSFQGMSISGITINQGER